MAAVAHAVHASRTGTEASSEAVFSERFAHFDCTSIPHLVALLCRPTASSVPSDTAVIVIDSLPTLINGAFPKGADNKQQGPPIGKGMVATSPPPPPASVLGLGGLGRERLC
jgi:hypothetical protein